MVFEPFPLQNGNRLCSLWSEIRFGFQGNRQSIQRCVFQAPSDQRGQVEEHSLSNTAKRNKKQNGDFN